MRSSGLLEMNRRVSVAPMMDWTGEGSKRFRYKNLQAAEMPRSLYVAATASFARGSKRPERRKKHEEISHGPWPQSGCGLEGERRYRPIAVSRVGQWSRACGTVWSSIRNARSYRPDIASLFDDAQRRETSYTRLL